MSRRLSGFLALLLSVAVVGCETGAGSVTLGALTGANPEDIRGASTDIDEPEEVELGRIVATGLGARYKLLRDEPMTRYVALVGNSVALQSERPDLRYYFGVLDSDEVNAFAAPGGYVFITRGTLALMRDEATLAAVLGHEVGHIALRHHNETIRDQKKGAVTKSVGGRLLDIGTGFMPGGAATATSVARSTGLAGLIGDGLINGALKGFSRAEEEQADGVGVKYATRAGYDAGGLRDFLRAVQEGGKQPAKSGFIGTFTSTHPGAEERLKEQENQLKTAQPGGRRAAPRFEQQVMAKAGSPAAKPPAQPTR